MFRQNFKNNLKNKIMCDDKFINNIFDLIEVIIDFNNKLYKRAMKKRYNQFYKRARNFFELTIKY